MSFYNQKWDKPYLTPSIAVELLTKTPYHARMKCPYFGPAEDKSSDAMNEGRVVDCLVLGGDPGVTVLDVPDYRTKEARELRDEAVNPMKIADYDRCANAASAAIEQIKRQNLTAADALADGKIKERIFWEDKGVYCSTEPDVWYDKGMLDCVYDLKRTSIAPTVENWRRHASSMKYHIQVAAGLEATVASAFEWIIVEESTGLVVVHPASPLFIAVGQRDWNYAKTVWENCLESDYFPAYESGEIDPTAWLIGDDREETNYAENDE